MADAETTPTLPPANTSECPNDEALKAFVDQETVDPSAERIDLDGNDAVDMAMAAAMIEEHLEGCDTCRAEVARLREIKALSDTQSNPAVSGPNPDESFDALDHAEPLHEHLEAFGEDPDKPAGPTPMGLW